MGQVEKRLELKMAVQQVEEVEGELKGYQLEEVVEVVVLRTQEEEVEVEH